MQTLPVKFLIHGVNDSTDSDFANDLLAELKLRTHINSPVVTVNSENPKVYQCEFALEGESQEEVDKAAQEELFEIFSVVCNNRDEVRAERVGK